MVKFLKKAYPFNNDLKHNAKVVFFISVIIGGFLFFFEPFNFNEFSFNERVIISLVISVITFAVLSFNMMVIPSFIKSFMDTQKWNIFKEILWNIWLLITVGFGYFIYFRFNPIFEIAPNDALKIILISILAISILVVLNQNRLMKLNVNLAIELNKKLSSKLNTGHNIVFFESEYKKDSISLTVNSIRVIKSAGNYIEIYYIDNGEMVKHFVRNTLSYAEKLLENYNFIFKCHRTYLVNTHFIKKAEGSPQGVKLEVENLDFLVPVSRNYLSKLQEII
jgi:hypothetical protein